MIGAIVVKRRVRSSFECLNRGDLNAFMRGWAEDAIFIYPGNLSISGTIQGKAAIEEWFRGFRNMFSEVRLTVKRVCVENIFAFGGTNVVTAEWDETLIGRDGKEYHHSGVTVISGEKGKAVQVCDYLFDLETVKQAWGER